MASHAFILGEQVSAERLSWLAGCLKYSYLVQHPDTLRHSVQQESPIFIFFLTGDALYSLHNRELLAIWDMILSLPGIWIVCDREELDLRGLSVKSLKMKYPDQIFDQNGRKKSYPRSFWRELIRVFRKHSPESLTFGYLLLASPYMNRSCQDALNCLHAAAEEQLSPELYAYLDGIHVIHGNQKPTSSRNIGRGLIDLEKICRKKNLRFLILGSAGCASSRGYVTWEGGDKRVISGCSINPAKIQDMTTIGAQMGGGHLVVGGSAASISFPAGNEPATPFRRNQDPAPSLVIFLCHTPYQTEYTLGGISLATACAHIGIHTRLVFIEDGVYSLLETHEDSSDEQYLSVHGLIGTLGADPNLEVYAYRPSMTSRGIVKDTAFNAVLEIEMNDLGNILMSPPHQIPVAHQRVLFM